MGRKPHPIISQYFERGPKINDKSNRYPQRCTRCGEVFPKGRIDSLMTHLTKRCPAISEADRINACLSLGGITGTGLRRNQAQTNGQSAELPVMHRDWSGLEGLEALAEVSRQIKLSEKQDGQPSSGNEVSQAAPGPANLHAQDRFVELQEQFTLDNPSSFKSPQQSELKGPQQPSPDDIMPDSELDNVEKLRALLQSADSSPDASPEAKLTMAATAAAATARLNPSLLDPQLRADDVPSAPVPDMDVTATTEPTATIPAPASSQPWGEITYLAETLHTPNIGAEIAPSLATMSKGGFRLGSPSGAKARHARARFDATRRKEVQEVRKIGACIRCRILRKTCSKGSPCDTCRKVLSPRIWRSGCVRTRISDQLDLYSAGVQIVLAQNRVNALKNAIEITNNGLAIEVTHFPESGVVIPFEVYQSGGPKSVDFDLAGIGHGVLRPGEIVMIDGEKEDVPVKIEAYMRTILREFVQRESSHFVRRTLETSLEIAQESNDELLKKAIELWGLVEILDRERMWQIIVKPTSENDEPRIIKEDTDLDVYNSICLQLTAGAERKAAAGSKSLLTSMQRVLQDSKTKVGYNMFFTTLILLNCIEKSTWAFKAWGQAILQNNWPLAKQPEDFTAQGHRIADLLKMLLGIRRALPSTVVRESDGMLISDDQDPVIQAFFKDLNLSHAEVQAKQDQTKAFDPTDPRSLDLLFCSTLLLPGAASA